MSVKAWWQIGELSEELETTADKLGVVEDDRDTMQETRDSYKRSPDCFKAKYEAGQSDPVAVKRSCWRIRRKGSGGGCWGAPY